MSLMSMRRNMASKRTSTIIFWGLIVVFLAGVALWSVPGGGRGGKKYDSNSPYADKVIAKVGGETITAGQIDDEYYKQQEANGVQFDVQSALQARQQAFDTVLRGVVTDQTTKSLKIRTWSWTLRRLAHELAEAQIASMHEQATEQAASQAKSAKTPADKKKLQTADQIFKSQLGQAVAQFGDTSKNPTEKDFIRGFVSMVMSKDEKTGKFPQFLEFARTDLIGENVAADLPTSPYSEDFVKKYNQKEVKASWIFIAATENTQKGLDAAKDKASKLHDSISKSPNTFSAVAKKESADFMTKMSGGDLGWVSSKSSNVAPMVQYLAFAQKENEIGPIMGIAVSNPFGGQPMVGYGFVKVDTIRDRADAKDIKWDQVKDGEMVRAKVQFSQGFGQNYLDLQQAKTNIVRESDELKYYEASMKDPTVASALCEKLQDDPSLPPAVAASFKYQVAQKTTDPSLKAKLLEGVISFAGSSQAVSIQMDLARAYAASGRKSDALQQLNYIVDSVESNDPDQSIHTQLKTEFTKLGDLKTAQRMADWMKTHPKTTPNQGMGGMPLNFAPQQ